MFTFPYTKAKRMVNGEIPLVIHGNKHNALREETHWQVSTPRSGVLGMVKVVKVERKPFGKIDEREIVLAGEEPLKFHARFAKKYAVTADDFIWVIHLEVVEFTDEQKAARVLEYRKSGRVMVDKYETHDWFAAEREKQEAECPAQ